MKLLRAGEGVRLVRDVMIPMRDGVLLAADLYVPDEPGRRRTACPSARCRSSWTTSPTARTRSTRRPARHYLELPRHGYIVARVDIRGHGRLRGPRRRRVRGPGAGRRLRRHRVAGRPAVVRRPREHDRHLVRRVHGAPGRDAPAAAPDLDHPGRLHGRPLHRRLPLPRRPAADVLRHRLVRHADDRLERDAARPRLRRSTTGREVWQRHIAEDEPYLLPGCATRSDGPYWRHGSVGGRRRPDHLPGVPDRRLARRLSEPAAAAVRAPRRGPDEAARRAVEPRATRTPASPGRGSTTCARWSAGSTTGAAGATPASWTSRRSSFLHAGVGARRSPTAWRAQGRGAPSGRGRPPGAIGARPRTRAGRPARRCRRRTTPVDDRAADRLVVRSRPSGSRAACGRAASRSGCPATSGGRGALPRLHVRAARGCSSDDPRSGAGGPHRRRRRRRHRVRGQPVRRRAGRRRRISSPRACSTARDAASLTDPQPLDRRAHRRR